MKATCSKMLTTTLSILGLAAGMYWGLTHGLTEAHGTHDWAEKNELCEEKVVLKEDKERIEQQLKAQGNGYCFIFINWPQWLLLRKDGEAR
ncbi:hypothetical protein RHGRI_008351 [Rhododendron griersonianum]|uniref:Uncharacterized protein n=1 Tax=Rhododendron griersonianum TaxID=479676 RepID=A0AAV6JIR3_9ERIC|nr:hypothetical protein RHGRI_031074 [Rhododendron griersonianum]KAG5526787.1 hypothetical protein RHGRI_032900 [Rhododendron griersonianum]KAG5539863.1 hypothetical protein RHGRI_020174 [Rhododendron griersonianum]KAG5542922.1 hypothetical protein RHGRI_015871 [Rhododendron griersonianum]KAG5548860.1 hypothetical protein RHGRI_014274 [Rhododendron griersonianum]